MPLQLAEGVILLADGIQQQISVFIVTLQPAFFLKKPGNAMADLVNEGVEFLYRGGFGSVKAHDAILVLGVNTIEKQYVKVDIQVQRRPERRTVRSVGSG